MYNIHRILKDVRVAVDENAEGGLLLESGDIDTLTLDGIVRSKVLEAVRRVETVAPVRLLDGGHNFGEAVYWGTMGSGWVLLPDDFMRLLLFRMDDWERPVYEAITPSDPEYALQSSRFKGLRGTAQKPVCALVMRGEGKTLEFYSCKSEEAAVTEAVYLPYPSLDEDDGVEICERCYEAVVYTAAALAMAAVGDTERSNLFNGLAKSLME